MAVFPVAPGKTDYSSGSTSNLIPAIYSGKLIGNFYKETFYSEICNTD